jgi:hypothetical protein
MTIITTLSERLEATENEAKRLHAALCAQRGVDPKWSGRDTNRAYYRRLAQAELRRAALKDGESCADAWKADAAETHLKLVAAEGERDEARAWSAERAMDIVTLGAALGAAEAQITRLTAALAESLENAS